MEKFSDFMFSGVAPTLYPTTVYFGVMWCDEDNCIELPLRYPFKGEWGEIMSYDLIENSELNTPDRIQIAWTSLCERQSYYLEEKLDSNALSKLLNENDEGIRLYSHIIIGMAPYGRLALWVSGKEKCSLFKWMKAAKIDIPMELLVDSPKSLSMENYCESYLSYNLDALENLRNNGLPNHRFYEQLMEQYNYCLNVMFQRWNGNSWILDSSDAYGHYSVKSIMIKRYDGSFDKTEKFDYDSYNKQGKPQIITIKWHSHKTEFSIHIWINHENIATIFSKIYGTHRESAIDFIIRIDAENKKYELALYRQGLKEPVVIPESAYQLIVFKNKFEDYRSENYNQPRGAWIW